MHITSNHLPRSDHFKKITLIALCYYKLKGPYSRIALIVQMIFTLIGITASILSLLEVLNLIHIGDGEKGGGHVPK